MRPSHPLMFLKPWNHVWNYQFSFCQIITAGCNSGSDPHHIKTPFIFVLNHRKTPSIRSNSRNVLTSSGAKPPAFSWVRCVPSGQTLSICLVGTLSTGEVSRLPWALPNLTLSTARAGAAPVGSAGWSKAPSASSLTPITACICPL